MTYKRRDFLKIMSSAALACPLAAAADSLAGTAALQPAAHWIKHGPSVVCGLCPRSCVITPGKRGKCRVRENRNGSLVTLAYGNPCSLNNDPIEKKPLFHVLPGTFTYSIATVGCNIECLFCQNWQISQAGPEDVRSTLMSPEQIVQQALNHKAESISFTYSEPTVWFEYMRDVCLAAKGTTLKKVLVSNGYINAKPQAELFKLVDAIKIDFKAFSETFYKDICSAHLRPVLDSLQRVKDSGVWLEMVMLMVPTLNDNERELAAMAKWTVQKLGTDVPLHFTRFHPTYKIQNLPPTSVKTLEKARLIAIAEGVRFAYAGNVPGHYGENTICPSCKSTLIERDGYNVAGNRIDNGKCSKCKTDIPGIWK